MSQFTLHTIKDTRSYESSECVRDDVSAIEDGGPKTEFATLVPFADKEESTGEERCFDKPEEESSEKGTDKTPRICQDGRRTS